MIAFGSGGSTPKQRMSQLSAGLGLLRGVVIDQHFEQRNRYGRLLSLVAQSPSLLGIGVDEDTAAVSGRKPAGGRRPRRGHGRRRPNLVATPTRPSARRRCWCRGDPARAACGQPVRPDPAHLGSTSNRCRTPRWRRCGLRSPTCAVARDIAAEGISPTNTRRLRRGRSG